MKRTCACLVYLFIVTTLGFAQQPELEWLNHIKLPVVVMEKNGDTVRGLKPDSFAISKGVKGAKVTAVQEVEPAEVNGKRPITIIYDGIANPQDVQKTARGGILLYLATAARANEPINLLITTQNGGRLVHSAGTPPAVTLVALEQLDKLTRALGGNFHSSVSPEEEKKNTEAVNAEFNRLREFEQKVETATFYRILSVQFETLQMIANGLAPVNGRKAILWITSQFPVKVDEGKKLLGLNSAIATDVNEWWVMTTEYEKAVRMLNAANISVYTAQPVRGAGLINQPGAIVCAPTVAAGQDLTFIGLNELSSLTGGTRVPFTTDVKKMVDIVQHDIGAYYVIDYELPAPPDRIDWKELGIKIAKDNVNVRRPDSLFLVSTRHQNH